MEVFAPILTGLVFVYLVGQKIREHYRDEIELTPFDPMELIHEDDPDPIVPDQDLKVDDEYYKIE